MNILLANYGNPSIAMIQWAIETQLANFVVLSVDTGWQSSLWQQRLPMVWNYLAANDVVYFHLNAQKSFAECVLDRGSFPSKKYQWCPSFLKGLAILDKLDELDMNCAAIIHLAKMRCVSRSNQTLVSGEENEHFDNRILNYPLLGISLEERNALIQRAGFEVLTFNSQECMPCIHATFTDWQVMSNDDLKRLESLEAKIGATMFASPLSKNSSSLEHYDMGCGNIWGCGE